MKSQILESEHFGDHKRHYFLDFSRSCNQSNFIRISRSDRQSDGSYKKSSVVVFEQDFEFLLEGFSMLFSSVVHREEMKQQQAGSKKAGIACNGIKSWPEEFRPREKMMAGGARALSEAELLAILIGSGTRGKSAVDLADQILKYAGGNLKGLSSMSAAQLGKFKGMGEAKALTVLASLEISRRISMQSRQFSLKAV